MFEIWIGLDLSLPLEPVLGPCGWPATTERLTVMYGVDWCSVMHVYVEPAALPTCWNT
jgi:hypothetical protein